MRVNTRTLSPLVAFLMPPVAAGAIMMKEKHGVSDTMEERSESDAKANGWPLRRG